MKPKRTYRTQVEYMARTLEAARHYAADPNAYVAATARKFSVSQYSLKQCIIQEFGRKTMTKRIGRRKRRPYGPRSNSRAAKAAELYRTTDMKQIEIAKVLGVTRQAVNQVINRAIQDAQ
jgi:hypothetical protein